MERILLRVEKVLMFVGMAALFIMMGLTTVDAMCRYTLNTPIIGAYEITEKYLMAFSIFLGISYTYRASGLIRVTILMDRLPQYLKNPINHFAQLFSIAYAVVLTVGTFQYATREYDYGTSLGSIFALPLWIGTAVVPLGLLLMGLFLIIDLPKVRKGKSALFQEEGPTAS